MKKQEAEARYRDAMTVMADAVGALHPEYGVTELDLAICLWEQKRFHEAEPLLLDAIRIGQRPTPEAAEAFLEIAYEETNRPGDAEALVWKRLERWTQSLIVPTFMERLGRALDEAELAMALEGVRRRKIKATTGARLLRAERRWSQARRRQSTLSFRSDDLILLSGSSDGINFWTIPEGTCNAKDGDGTVSCFLAQGDRVLVGGSSLYSLDPDLQYPKDPNSPVTAVAASRDGRMVAAGYANGAIGIYDSVVGRESIHIASPTGPVSALAFNTGGEFLMSAAGSDSVRVWDTTSGINTATLASPAGVIGLAFSGPRCYAAARDGTVDMWDVSRGVQLRSFCAPGAIGCFTLSSDGWWILLGLGDGTACLIDTFSGEPTVAAKVLGLTCVALSPSGRWMAVGADNEVQLWELTWSSDTHPPT